MGCFDIIGDIHGFSTELIQLLTSLDYKINEDGCYSHKNRKAVFVGDFIDRGNGQKSVIDIVKAMVENGSALAVMGNHEFNAISYHTLHPSTKKPLRKHTEDNTHQHQAFLSEFTNETELDEAIEWFKTLPLFLELDEIRIIHACWNDEAIASIKNELDDKNCINDAFLIAANTKGTYQFDSIETLLKGVELKLPGNASFKDSYGKSRQYIRMKWWPCTDLSYKSVAIAPKSVIESLPEINVPVALFNKYQYEVQYKPVFFGHYWFTGAPKVQAKNVACLDYSVAKNGVLTAYRWDKGDKTISDNKLIQALT